MKPLFKYLSKMVLLYSIFLTSTFHTFAQTWNQIIKVTAQNNGGSSARSDGDFYGTSVSISGNYAIVGANFEDHDANGSNFVDNAGAVYILYNDAGNWAQVKKITAPNRGAFDEFGFSVSINGDYVVVGAHTEDEDALETNTLENSGSVYIFKKDQGGTNNWGFVKKITASIREIEERFGYAVSIKGDYLIVGAYADDEDANETNTVEDSGSAYIFKKDQGGADNWGQIQKITASNRGIQDRFGYAVCINGDYAIVGDPFEEDIDYPEANTIYTSGSAYIFKKDQGGADNWGLIQKLTASVRNRGDNFGNKVAINSDYAIVGAPYQKEDAQEANTLYSSGAAYIFKRDQGGADNWGQIRKITASPRAAEDFFGRGVSISGEYLIAAAPGEDQDVNELNTLMGSGSAYIFKKDQGGADNWGQVQKITASVRARSDFFANSVAIDGNHLIAGALAEDHDASESNTVPEAGSAYIFNYTPPLPVTLITFNASKIENQAMLTWTTTMESNSDYFDIQKSASGFSWKTLERVPAAMNSDQHRTYSFIDISPLAENSSGLETLYRLKMVDLDGSYTYSRIVSLSFTDHLQTILYPNPVSNKLYYDLADAANITSISIINSAGQIMSQSFEYDKAGIPVNHLPPGIYLVQIRKKAGTVQFKKIVVAR